MQNYNQTNLQAEVTQLRQDKIEIENTLQELLKQDSLIEKWTIMKNFVLVSTEVERLSHAYVALEQEHQFLLNTQNKDVQQSEQKLKILITQLEELNALMIQQQNRIEDLNKNNNMLKQAINEATQKMQVMSENNKQLKYNEQILNQEKQKLQNQLSESNNELNNIMQTLKECEDMYKGTIFKQETTIKNLYQQNESLKGESNKKDKVVDQLMKKNNDLINDIERMDRKYNEQSLQMKKISKMYESLEQDYNDFKLQQQGNQSEFHQLSKRIEHKNQVLVDLENKYDKLNVIVKAQEAQLQEKDQQINQFSQQLIEQQTLLIDMRNSKKQVKNDNESEVKQLTAQVKRLQDKIMEIRGELESETILKERLQACTQNKEVEFEKLYNQNEDLKSEQQALKRQVSELQQALNVEKSMFLKVQLEYTGLRDQIRQTQEKDQIQDQMNLEEECVQLREECELLRNDVQYFKYQNQQQQQQIEELRQTKTYLSNILMDRRQY
ncbi:unnamed protein product (macronuclear) [Paramecium tetraurelia]|uniref:Uncharacterized protein n=1 Tax=Paramecium tetraurelia TaxID=5888 RepID=A0C878_PARTE|nr:uncharacterized protein GSPATT00036126001 [Paramecium tetraurelia]CAK66995.1 unnamed protein product [Paramecium tetraurelia]|eukprot:XP_001434392.1 hypothetical protein (macronuclear) [Paramecium tetraurelia strain d4-2]